MSINKGTIIRTVVLALALVNQVLTMCDMSVIPIEDDQISEFISLAMTIGASVWTWWKNNSFTKNAIEADKFLAELKHNDSEMEG